MAQNHHLAAFVKSIDPLELRIASYSNTIFICGGPRNKDDNSEAYSARDFLLRKLLPHHTEIFSRLRYEDSMLEWFRDGHFTDLQSFEKHICEIASVVFLVAESPGSFTELGTFANEPSIYKKLLVLVSNEIDTDDSYIGLGPLKFLREREKAENSVISYPWRVEPLSGCPPRVRVNADDLEGIWKDIVRLLLKFDERPHSESRFDPKVAGHTSVLIVDLLQIFGALQHNEILHAISSIVEGFERKDLKRHLFLLEKMELIIKKSHGCYFFLANSTKAHIHYGYKPDTNTDIKNRGRLSLLARRWFEENDPARFNVIKQNVLRGTIG